MIHHILTQLSLRKKNSNCASPRLMLLDLAYLTFTSCKISSEVITEFKREIRCVIKRPGYCRYT